MNSQAFQQPTNREGRVTRPRRPQRPQDI